MTIDTSTVTTGGGLAAAQARVAQIQSLFTSSTAPAAMSATAGNPTFGDAMTRAGTTAGSSTRQSSDRSADPARAQAAAAAVAPAALAPTPGAAASSAVGATASGASVVTPRASAAATKEAAVSSVAASSRSSAPATAGTTTTAATAHATASSAAGLKSAEAVIATAKKYLGIPYRWGGTDPRTGLDCSGFVQLVMKQHGVSLPRVSRDQARQGIKVPSLAQARPGDLVAFGSPVHHIGIYVGNGMMIHAPRTGDVVKISKVHKNMTAIRRVLPDQGSVAALASPVAAPAAAKRNVTASSVPAAGVDTTRLAATLRNAALSPGVDASTWQQAVATAVQESLRGSDVQNAQTVMQTALAGLGTTPNASAALLDATTTAAETAASSATARTAATTGASNPGRSLAPDARGTLALDQAPAAYREMFIAAERKYGVPATLLAAVAKQESNFKARAVSHAGAQGLMQLMPGTARGLGVRNAFDPQQAIDGAARLLRSHLRAFGSTELALAAYNAGAGAVRKYDGVPPYGETRNYVRRIMGGLRETAA